MFEAYTYEALLADVLANAPEGIDTRQGSIFYDAVSGICLQMAKMYIDLDNVFSYIFVSSAVGEHLDERASEYGLERQAATKAEYILVHEGTAPSVGSRFFHNETGYYFTVETASDGTLLLVAEESGSDCDSIQVGDPAIPVNTITGLLAASFGAIYAYGLDEETDDALRTRVLEKISNPSENGNKQHYKTWCESVSGVGLARIFPLWNGPNTVKAVLINSLGMPCDDETVAACQEYVDPATKGYTAVVDGVTYVVGDGLGEGVANIGAHFTAAAATAYTIDIAFDAQLRSGYTADEASKEAADAIAVYFQTLAMQDETEDIVVRLTAVGSIISGLMSVEDYSNLTMNGEAVNIEPGENAVPIVGEVDVS